MFVGDVYMLMDCRLPLTDGRQPGLFRVDGTIVIIPMSLERSDTLGFFDLYETWLYEVRGGVFGGARTLSSFLLGFGSPMATGGHPTRVAFSRFDRQRVMIYDLNGAAPVRIIEWPAAKRAPTATELDSARARFDRHVAMQEQVFRRAAQRNATTPGTASLAAFHSEMKSAGEHLPDSATYWPISRLLVDELNHVWVAQDLDTSALHARTWAVFRPDGVLLGELNLPADLDIREIGADYILGTRVDEFGVPTIVMHGLQSDTPTR